LLAALVVIGIGFFGGDSEPEPLWQPAPTHESLAAEPGAPPLEPNPARSGAQAATPTTQPETQAPIVPPAAVPTATVAPTAAPVEPAATSRPSSAPTTAHPSTAAAAPEDTAEAESVHIQIRTRPADAQLTMDGRPVTNPFDARVFPSGEHRLIASKEGYEDHTASLRFDRNRSVTLTLQRARTSTAAPSSTTTTRPRRRPTKRSTSFVSDNPY
jgi:hypothetical protein